MTYLDYVRERIESLRLGRVHPFVCDVCGGRIGLNEAIYRWCDLRSTGNVPNVLPIATVLDMVITQTITPFERNPQGNHRLECAEDRSHDTGWVWDSDKRQFEYQGVNRLCN